MKLTYTHFPVIIITLALIFTCNVKGFGEPENLYADEIAPQKDSTEVSKPTSPQFDNEQIFDFYPNPATEVLNVKAKDLKLIEIVNMAGRIVIKKKCKEDVERVDLSACTEGLHFIRVTTKDDKVSVAKFIKK